MPSMRLQVQLVHAEAGARVVLVSAWEGGDCLGSALGEASDAEQAQDRAEERLRLRLGRSGQVAEGSASPPRAAAPAASPADADAQGPPARSSQASAPVLRRRTPLGPEAAARPPGPSEPEAPAPAPARPDPVLAADQGPAAEVRAQALDQGPGPSGEPSPDPEDWSDDLARIDLEVQRLGWDRSQEATYLQRAFGHPSRSRLTRYGDLVAYLQALAQLASGADPGLVPLPLRRRDLLEQCDELLARLGWDPDQGRLFLELNFQCSSRQHLSDPQLLQFNMLLEEQLIQAASPGPA